MKNRDEPNVVIVGVAGASGSGKSFFSHKLQQRLIHSSLLLSQDDYYKDRSDISLREREAINYDHPNALDFELLIDHLKILKMGGVIEHPLYDFAVHNRKKETKKAGPARAVIVDGILLYAVQECRKMFDIRVYVDTPLDICFIRRLQRDVKERGRSVESVVNQYMQTVRPMFVEFVQPTREFADMVVKGLGDMHADIERVLENCGVRL